MAELVRRLAKADLSRKDESARKADAHVTANKFSKELVQGVHDGLSRMTDVMLMVSKQRSELGYQ